MHKKLMDAEWEVWKIKQAKQDKRLAWIISFFALLAFLVFLWQRDFLGAVFMLIPIKVLESINNPKS
jgi:hypothetical protein